MSGIRLRATALALVALFAASCVTRIGPRALPAVRTDYNEAVARSSNEQMLLNLVRLRFSHSTQFLEPVNVVTTYSFSRNLGIGGSANLNGESSFSPITSGSINAGVVVTETPTVTYAPLSGEAFVRQLAAPLPPDLLIQLVQGGWPMDLLLQLTVSRIGSTRAPVIAARGASAFSKVLADLTLLLDEGLLEVDAGDRTGPRLGFVDPDRKDARDLYNRLGVSLEASPVLRLTHNTVDPPADAVPFVTRSMMNLLFYLSHGVDVESDDPTARDLGVPLPVNDPLLRVQSSPVRPDEAYVAVEYRGRWFWIGDDDLASKRTFGVLMVLFSVMSAPSEASSPLLTLP